jgi:hypothetical protein
MQSGQAANLKCKYQRKDAADYRHHTQDDDQGKGSAERILQQDQADQDLKGTDQQASHCPTATDPTLLATAQKYLDKTANDKRSDQEDEQPTSRNSEALQGIKQHDCTNNEADHTANETPACFCLPGQRAYRFNEATGKHEQGHDLKDDQRSHCWLRDKIDSNNASGQTPQQKDPPLAAEMLFCLFDIFGCTDHIHLWYFCFTGYIASFCNKGMWLSIREGTKTSE